jgi:hypothetical protein
MSLKVTHCLRLSLSLLFFIPSAGASASARAPQQQRQQGGERAALNQGASANSERGKVSVKAKERYSLGEAPTVTISVTNTDRSPRSLKEAEHRKFFFEVTGTFENDARQEKKALVYDGSWDIPKASARPPQPNETQVWESPRKREPKYVTLLPGESTDLTLNLSDTFRSYLGVGKYLMAVKSEDGQRVVKDFEVYFDDEKSAPVLAKMLASDDTAERDWALYNLVHYSRPRLTALLEELARSGNEKQRDFAGGVLAQLSAGHFDPVKLRVENKERYFLGEAPVVAVSILNGGSAVQTLKGAEYQKFSFELVKAPDADSKPETKTCVYGGERDAAKQPAGRAPQKPELVKLSELEATTVSVNLFECFRSRLDVGKYELTVKAADEQQVLKGQRVVKRFEVYFDGEKSVSALAQVLKSDDAAERQWAVSILAQYSRPKLVALLEELARSGNEKQRDFAGRILAEIKAGRFGSNTSPSTKQHGGKCLKADAVRASLVWV